MRTPLILFILSCIFGSCAWYVQGAASDLVLLAALCGFASLVLLGLVVFAPKSRRKDRAGGTLRPGRKRIGAGPKWIVVDGSNVMHWKDGTPDIATLCEVTDHLIALGFSPGVVFDANVGYKISGAYKHDGALAQMLGLAEDRVMVVPKGTVADELVLAAARDLGARIVTNDRYRDWEATHPEVKTQGHLIRGGYRDGKLWLQLPDGSAAPP